MFLYRNFIGGEVNKCLDIKKYSDKSQKQAVFFRNPYDSIASAIVKARVDTGLSFEPGELNNIDATIAWYAKEYLEAIKEAKANQSNIYLGKSEDAMQDPISVITDIALFFGLNIQPKQLSNEQVIEQIRKMMFDTEKTRVNQDGSTIVEHLMTDHDGHLPREKTAGRILIDHMVKNTNSDILKECYNEYISIKPTMAKEGQRWGS